MMPTSLLSDLFGAPAAEAAFSDSARIAAMLAFEVALASAEEAVGVIPAGTADVIASVASSAVMDQEALARGIGLAGNTAIPLVKAFTALVAARDPEAARFVHFGATSQDVEDTALVLQLVAAVEGIRADLDRAIKAAARLTLAHRATPMAGRTWLQQALPITFGLKMAGHVNALRRHRIRIDQAASDARVLQFGGAVGTLAALGDKGLAVSRLLAAELKLTEPTMPWHGHRDRLFALASTLAGLVMTLGKLARDVGLMMQTEIGEVFEPTVPGRGGSSTMPHKRNPMLSATILGAATVVPGLLAACATSGMGEHERAPGAWQGEWLALPELVRLSAGAIGHAATLLEGLEVVPERMAGNLALTNGLLMAEAVQMALSPALGRLAAHDRIEAACREAVASSRPLIDVLAEDSVIGRAVSRDELARLLDPSTYLGVADAFITRALEGLAQPE